METTSLFVIASERSDKPGVLQYVGIDHDSGGYPYWDSFVGRAKFFANKDEAWHFMTSDDFAKPRLMGNDEIYPSRMIHSALGLCNAKLKGTGRLMVLEVKFEEVMQRHMSGSLPMNMRKADLGGTEH